MEYWILSILLHHILDQFVPVNYRISTWWNAKEYLAINQINRKYYIWQKIILNISSNFPNFTISDLCNKDSWLWSNLSFFIWIFQILNFLNFLSFAIFRILRFFLEFQIFRILRFLKNRQFFHLNFPNFEFFEFYDFSNFIIF